MDYIPDVLQQLLPVTVGDVVPLSDEVKDIELLLKQRTECKTTNTYNNIVNSDTNKNVNSYEESQDSVNDQERRDLL